MRAMRVRCDGVISTPAASLRLQPPRPSGPKAGGGWRPVFTPTRPQAHCTSRAHRRILRPALVCLAGPREKFEEDNKRYAALTAKIEAAAATAVDALQGTSIYLVGMMGSGKSTVGRMVSQALGYCFFDTDSLIEQLAGKTIPEIFAEDGEEDFRAIETQVLQELAPFKNCIIATGGGAATRGMNWGHMQGGISIWLNGPPTLLARRVVQDGTSNRPLLAQQHDASESDSNRAFQSTAEVADSVMEEYEATVVRITELLNDRYEQYAFADITVSLEGDNPGPSDMGAPAAVVALRILAAIDTRISRDAAWREERKQFEVVNDSLPPTMRVVKSINPAPDMDTDPYLP